MDPLAPSGAPPVSSVAVSVAVPEDWYLVPSPSAARRGAVSNADDAMERLASLVDQLADRIEEADVALCAFGTLPGPDGGDFGAALALGVLASVGPGQLRDQVEQLAADDPACMPQEEICVLELAGPAARLAWAPPAGPSGRRVACADYYVPFPADGDDRVAVLSCSATGIEPTPWVFEQLDALAAMMYFMIPSPGANGA